MPLFTLQLILLLGFFGELFEGVCVFSDHKDHLIIVALQLIFVVQAFSVAVELEDSLELMP